jgi:biotin/methionine sulfoxide reductase
MPDDGIMHGSHWGAFRANVKDGRVVGVTPFEDDKDPSQILDAIPEMLYGPTRIAEPHMRKSVAEHGPGANPEGRGAEPFVPVSWDQALDVVAAELRRVKADHGNEAIFGGSYGWSSAGRFHHAKTQMQRFMNLFGGFTGQLHNYSYAAALAVLPHILGSAEASQGPVSDWDGLLRESKFILCFGGMPLKNAQVDSGGGGSHTMADFLKRAEDQGIRFVNVSPVREDLEGVPSAEWIPIHPGTDTAMILAMAHVIASEGKADRSFLDTYCVGYERFLAHVMGEDGSQAKTPDWAADITGVPADTIRALALALVETRSYINMAWGIQRADYGELPFWAVVSLAAMVGQIGQMGGGFGFGMGSVNGMGNPRERTPSPTLPAGINRSDSWIPVARIADMLLHPGETYDFNGEERVYPDTRLIYWCGGNPFHHHQDLNRLVEAWRRPETVIVQDIWWTATARHADIALPATTTLERNDIGSGGRDPYIIAMHKAAEPVADSRSDHDIFTGLSDRMGFKEAFTEGRTEREWLEHIYNVSRQLASRRGVEMPGFDQFWENGHFKVPKPAEPFVMLGEYRADPDERSLNTPSGKIELFSERVAGFGYDDCPGYAAWREPKEYLGSAAAAKYPLHMLSNQPKTRLHSQMDAGGASRRSKIKGREPMWINPDDATDRDLKDGDVVRVFNDRGQTLAGVIVSDIVMPGVIQFPTGAWFDPLDRKSPGAALEKHGNPNVLTRDEGTSKLGQGPSAHSALVQVERYDGDLPEVTVHQKPV